MSSLAATQIPKPSDAQAFERANVILWGCLLRDPNVQRNGRLGQRQNGVDLFGIRNGDATHHVGIQCKLKSHDQELTETEVRAEVRKALTFKPPLREYFIVTTAPDDVAMQELSRTLTAELQAQGHTMRVLVWGWNTLEERIADSPEARNAFDPSFTPHSQLTFDAVQKISADMTANFQHLHAQFAQGPQGIGAAPGDATGSGSALEAHLDAEIDRYRAVLNDGRPKTALEFLTQLLDRVREQASGRIIFRIKANIGSCHLMLGDLAIGADLISEAYEHAPTEPKAIANRAYALLLKGQWQEALHFATEKLAGAPDNDALAGYLIQAALREPAVEQPLALVPAALHETAPVLIAVAHFLRQRKREWYEVARRAVQLHPADQQLQMLAAEAVLDEIGNDPAHQSSGALSSEQRARMLPAIEVLAAHWKQAQLREGGIQEVHASTCANLIMAYRAIGNLPMALEVARQGRAAAPRDEGIARRAMVVAMESDDLEMATAALAVLLPGPDTTVLAVGLHARNGAWREVADMCAVIPEGVEEHDRINLTTLGRVAALKLGPAAARREALESLVAETAEDFSASLIAYQAARSEKAQDLCDAVYARLVEKVDDTTHRAERYGVAHLAAKRHEWSTVADLLDGHVAEDQDGDELGLLARAYINERPIRERGIRFFERLPATLQTEPFFVEAVALFHFNRGDLPKAEAALRAAIRVSPTAQCHLALFSTLRRLERVDEVGPLLEELEIESLSGSPAERIELAGELRAQGRGADAMRIAYDILNSARNDPDAALRYVGLVMSDPDTPLIPTTVSVTEDCWVRLESSGSAPQSYLIAAGPDRPAEGVIGLTHPMALKCLGLKVDDTFEVELGMGQRATWRVAQIKHKYLHTLHEVMEHFQTWFPDRPGLWKYSLKDDGDVTPFLDQIKLFGEHDRKLADLYLENHLPLEMVAAKSGREGLGLAEYIRSLGKTIRACHGTEPERAQARELIRQHRQSILVMDTYTAWVVASADILDVLTTMFAGFAVPQSTIDDIVGLKAKHSIGRGRSMNISWRDGEFVRQEFTDEDLARHQAYIGEQIDKLQRSCQVVPVVAPDAMSELAKFLTSSFGTHILDPVFLASQRVGLLLSEDMYFRQIGNAALPVAGVWLQIILMVARAEGLIDAARYRKALVQLAVRGHAHLTVGANDLLAVFDADDSEPLWSFRSVAASLGGPGAEMRSHLRVADEFFGLLWERGHFPRIWRVDADRKRGKATGMVLERLVANRSLHWEYVLAFLYSGGDADLRRYVEGWIVGHFFSMDAFRAELERFTR